MERLTNIVEGVTVYVGPGNEHDGGSIPAELYPGQVRTVMQRLAAYENTTLTTISIATENIVYVTYQHNGWVRKNIYWRDGTQEETFDGRWKSATDHA